MAKEIKQNRCISYGFTLIELMAVLAILAIIAAIAVPKFAWTVGNAKKKADEVTQRVLQGAVDLYMIDNDGDEPTEAKLSEGYIEGDWPKPQVQGMRFKLEAGKVEYIEDPGSG